jgi:hypothetical protein
MVVEDPMLCNPLVIKVVMLLRLHLRSILRTPLPSEASSQALHRPRSVRIACQRNMVEDDVANSSAHKGEVEEAVQRLHDDLKADLD